MSDQDRAQISSITQLAIDLQNKALTEAEDAPRAVSALLAAAVEILCMTFPPAVAASLIVQVSGSALLGDSASLLTAVPMGEA